MKSFLLNCLGFGLPMLALLTGIGFLADGYTDKFYLKCASPRQSAMIIGISRAGLGLQPAIFDSALAKEYPQTDLYNFAFTLHWTPFGKVYFDAINEKLAKGAGKGFFIVSVDPWSIANFKDEQEDLQLLRENNSGFGRTKQVATNPNYSYFINAYAEPYMSVLSKKLNTSFFNTRPEWLLHNDGWLEVSVPMDSASVAQRFRATMTIYINEYLPFCRISPIRQAWLVKTIALLKEHGDVYLVRLPVHPALLACDNKLYPQFSAFMDSIASREKIPWFNFSDSCAKYTYIDGSHLYKSSGALVSNELCRLIQNYRHTR